MFFGKSGKFLFLTILKITADFVVFLTDFAKKKFRLFKSFEDL